MTAANDLSGLVPGFEFLQNLVKGAAMPGMQGFGQWVAPTLDPAELDKRIQELKTVQFWLEQNARLLGTTVQALEVQRMTLSTLQSMNLSMAPLREALTARAPVAASNPPAAAPAAAQAADASRRQPPAAATATATGASTAGDAPAPAIDPLQWWAALTQQFTQIAAQAVRDGAADAAGHGAASVAPSAAGSQTDTSPAASPARASRRRKG
jgi:hypothetical protein